jgi:hypothetical protein
MGDLPPPFLPIAISAIISRGDTVYATFATSSIVDLATASQSHIYL